MTERDIFLAALDKDRAERATFLDEACGGDAALRRGVEALLRLQGQTHGFLGVPAVEQLAAPTPPDTPDCDAADAETLPPRPDGPPPLDFLAPSRRPGSLGRLGHYEVFEVVGAGGMGIVLRAFDDKLHRVVAIKALLPALASSAAARQRFVREARAAAAVTHDNVIDIHAVEDDGRVPYLVMKFIDGPTLQEKLDRTGPLPVKEVLRIGLQTAAGLAAAHAQGLVHRDVKPANVLLENGVERVTLTDFGLARTVDDASLTQSGMVAGTPAYMSPEQASGARVDHRSDLFSLGSVLYTLCAGHAPFRAETTMAVLKRVCEEVPRPLREVNPDVPDWLEALIARLQAKKPADRFASAHEVADLLTQHLAQLHHPRSVPATPVAAPAAASPPPPTQVIPAAAPARRPRLRSRRWAAAAAVLLLLGGLGITEATGVTDVRGTVIRLFSPQGTLVVEVDDPGVSVAVDGGDVVITGAGAKEIRLKPGRYVVETTKDGKLVSRELVAVTNNGRQVVRVSQEPVTVPRAASEKKDPDRRAAEYALSIGGAVYINGEDRYVRAVAELPQGAFRLTAVYLDHNKQVTDAGLAAFEGCTNVTVLWLYDCRQVTDAGLAHFKDCRNLSILVLEHVQVTDAALAAFAGYDNLTNLQLGNTQVTDAGLVYLKDCKNLTAIQLLNTPVTDAGLAHLKDRNNLTYLDLRATKVTDTGLAYFKDCKDLRVLWLGGTSITDAGLAVLKDCKNLTGLDLTGTSITDDGLAVLKDCKNLKWLSCEQTAVSDLSPLRGIALEALNIAFTRVTDLAPLRGMPLQRLSLTGVTDLSPLRGMPLQALDLRSTPLSDPTPLQGLPLKEIVCDFEPKRDAEKLRSLRSLEKINGKPAAEFWKEVDGK
jgi:hypothetical protein